MNLQRLLNLLLVVFCALLVYVSATPAWLVYWADSEIWSVATSLRLVSRSNDFEYLMKPLFHGALWLTNAILEIQPGGTRDIASAMDHARVLMSGSFLLLIYSLYRFSRVLNLSFFTFVCTIALLLAHPLFFDQILRIRSDLLALPFVFLAYSSLFERKHYSRWLLFALTAFWITPKSGLFFIALLAVPAFRETLKNNLKRCLQLYREKSFLAFAVSILAVLIITWQLDALRMALQHFANEFPASQMGFSYFDTVRWSYVVAALSEAYWFWLLSLIPICHICYGVMKQKIIHPVYLLSVANIFLLILNPSKLPFLIACHLPLLALSISISLDQLLCSEVIQQSRTRTAVASIVTALVLSIGLGSLTQQRTNLPESFFHLDQSLMISELSLYAHDFPNASYYDGVGLLRDRPLSSFFIGPGQREQNEGFNAYLVKSRPSLIAMTQKVSLMNEQIQAFLSENYLPSPSGLYRKSLRIEPEQIANSDALFQLFAAEFAFDFYPSTKLYGRIINKVNASKVSPWEHQDGLGLFAITEIIARQGLDLEPGETLLLTPFPPFVSQLPKSFIDVIRFRRAFEAPANFKPGQ